MLGGRKNTDHRVGKYHARQPYRRLPPERVGSSVIGDVDMVVHRIKCVWSCCPHEEWPGQKEPKAPPHQTTVDCLRHVASDICGKALQVLPFPLRDG